MSPTKFPRNHVSKHRPQPKEEAFVYGIEKEPRLMNTMIRRIKVMNNIVKAA